MPHTQTYKCPTCQLRVRVFDVKRWAKPLAIFCGRYIVKAQTGQPPEKHAELRGPKEQCGARMILVQ